MALKNENLVDAVVAAFGKQTGLSIYPEIKNPESGSVQLFLEGFR